MLTLVGDDADGVGHGITVVTGVSGTVANGGDYALNIKELLHVVEPASGVAWYIAPGINAHGTAYQQTGVEPRPIGGGGDDNTFKQAVVCEAWRGDDGQVWIDVPMPHDGECA
jgi:hypothetical protein